MQTKESDNLGIRFIWIDPGDFDMGRHEDIVEDWPGNNDSFSNERPIHSVSFKKGFWISIFPITVGQYMELVKGKGLKAPEWVDLSGSDNHWIRKGEIIQTTSNVDCPVTGVSWFDGTEFCRALSELNGTGEFIYRLPFEAEWEYVCKAGGTSDRYGEISDIAWYEGNSKEGSLPVGQKLPNQWGLFDMLGNVSEWCMDWSDDEYYNMSPKADPKGPDYGEYKITRGGSWDLPKCLARASCRNHAAPGLSANDVGFRVVKAVK